LNHIFLVGQNDTNSPLNSILKLQRTELKSDKDNEISKSKGFYGSYFCNTNWFIFSHGIKWAVIRKGSKILDFMPQGKTNTFKNIKDALYTTYFFKYN